MKMLGPKTIQFFSQLKVFVDKGTFNFYSFNKINNFITIFFLTTIFLYATTICYTFYLVS